MTTDMQSPAKPFIHGLFSAPMSGQDIEDRSFAVIDEEAPPHAFSPSEWQIVRRMIHTTGDFGIMEAVRFSPDAVASGILALREGRPLYVDSNMIRSGLSAQRLKTACGGSNPGQVYCHIADPDVAAEARDSGLPRSLFAIRKAKAVLNGGIAVFGNAPVALLELNRMVMEEGVKPALVVAMPVGFVHVVESKEEIMSLNIPYIALTGRRGGSPIAVSVIHCPVRAGSNTVRRPL